MKSARVSPLVIALGSLGLACSGGSGESDDASASASATATVTVTASATVTATSTSTATGTGTSAGTGTSEGTSTAGETTATSEGTGHFKFDVAGKDDVAETGGVVVPSCKVTDDSDATGPCTDKAPADAFDPEVQWSWAGDQGQGQAFSIPLVANLTDDDMNGEIDLCDVPDIVIQVFANYGNWSGGLYVLDGATGAVHWQAPVVVDTTVTPALGDIDGDGIPEIVAFEIESSLLVAFEHDGALKWKSSAPWPGFSFGAIGMADLDNDGDVEIFAGNQIYDHNGTLVTTLGDSSGQAGWGSATVAADLDGDGDLEIVLGRSAFHHTGAPLFNNQSLALGYPQVADLDGDGLPEVLVETQNGISMLEHDGTLKFMDLRPTGATPSLSNWYRPSTVHDFDGDNKAEFAVSSYDKYAVYEGDGTVTWSAQVLDATGIAGSTAFDFLGDGVAEAMYADETNLYTYDGKTGQVLLQVPRSSGTIIEYPVVADVDNDGSAEVLVVSNASYVNNQTAPALQVIRDKGDRWIPARRIWNQHTYHVTNVREDGTIPQFEKPHWKSLNTFRTQAQIGAGGVCKPMPPG
ncbi:MAG: VCBS repeat-containing protein [Nannocystaceae bacterium]